MTKIRAIIWDMDGTLVDSDKYYGEIFPAVPHAEKVLAELQGKYLLGLATSAGKASAKAALERLGLLKYFGACTYGSEVSRGKPDPEIFLTTAEKLGVEASECVVIEDSLPGFNGAKSAGMRLIARRAVHNLHQDFSLADAVVEDLLEVVEVVEKLENNG